MNRFLYVGPTVNLGEFGTVKKNDVLHLTPKEAECIKRDNRFKAVKEGTKLPKPGEFVDLENCMRKEDVAPAIKANEAEQSRLDHIAEMNKPESVAKREFQQISSREMREEAERMNNAGALIEFTRYTPKRELADKILKARSNVGRKLVEV